MQSAIAALVQAVMESDGRMAVSALSLWHVRACTAARANTTARERVPISDAYALVGASGTQSLTLSARWDRQQPPASSALHCTQQSSSSECQRTACRMRCVGTVFMLLHGTHHGKCTPPCGRGDEVSAQHRAAGEISLHSHSLQSSSMATAINMLNESMLHADHKGVVLMGG